MRVRVRFGFRVWVRVGVRVGVRVRVRVTLTEEHHEEQLGEGDGGVGHRDARRPALHDLRAAHQPQQLEQAQRTCPG